MKKLSILFLMSGFLTSNITQSRPLISGKTYRASNSVFEAGAPIRASIFNSESVAQHSRNGNKGGFQFVVYGGKNTKRDEAAAYFMPYGHTKYTVQGQQEFTKLDLHYDLSSIVTTTTGPVVVVPKTFAYDNNKLTNILRPWNFGITFAATYDPAGDAGVGVSYSPQFKSTISPTFHSSHAGVGGAFKYHFSSEPQSFWVEAATAVEWKKNELRLNEKVEKEKEQLNVINFPTTNISGTPTVTFTATGAGAGTNATNTTNTVTTANIKSEVSLVWINTIQANNATAVTTGSKGTGWPVSETVDSITADVANLTQAFTGKVLAADHHKNWKYGKLVAGGNKKTALADIELKFGYNFISNPNYSSNGYVGVIIPTGNKADAEFLDQAVVGNNKHFGLMMGGATSIELNNSGNWTTSYKVDMNSRYLMRNVQKRSFDLYNNEGSRNLMVWEKTKWEAALTAFGPAATRYSKARDYSAGINFFTKDMHVTPGFQAKINQSFVMQSDKSFVELGWNISARQAEKTSLTKSWTETIAFPDATITPLNGSLLLARENTTYRNGSLTTTKEADTTWQTAFEITEAQINLESAATPQSISHTPYASLHYTWGDANSSRPGSIGVGGSYEFTQNNARMNEWNVWGALSFNF
jgi:hypothetical protein